MQNISLLPAVLAFALSVAMGPVLIPVLKKLRVGQTVEDGPGTHLKKNGTPTMGGIIIVGAMILTGLLFVKRYPKIMPILFLTAGFGMVGLLDDYLKVVLRRSMGLSPGAKLLLQLLVTALYAVYLSRYADSAFLLKIPFSDRQIELGVFNVPFLFFVTTATVNGTEFYGWTGRCCHGRHPDCDGVLFRSRHWHAERDRAGDGRGSGRIAWISFI